jgi:membrane fusion protein (multidrug efflux system)
MYNKSNRMKNLEVMRADILPVVTSLVLSIIITACKPSSSDDNDTGSGVKEDDSSSVTVRTMTVRSQQIVRSIEYTSTLAAFKEVHMAPASPGRIDKINVEIGSRVSKGDILVQMNRTQLQQAMVQLKNIETDFKRLDTLQKTGSIAEQKYDQVKAQYEIAKSNVDFLQENTILRAPFDGIISGKYYEEGEMYSGVPNTQAGKSAILSIVSINSLKAIVGISERYYPLISNDMKANIKSDIYPDKVFTGKIYRIHPTIDPSTRSFQVEIEVANPGLKLRPGMFVRASVNYGIAESILVPSVAVLKQTGTNERYVFINENNKAARKTVQTGIILDDNIEITNGLKTGEELITTGQNKLEDNTIINIVN